ncbi:MAG: acyl carrier protein [Lentisphaerae bacterium]|nr:acyl carrier protein [Lentisphaerota bacterium]
MTEEEIIAKTKEVFIETFELNAADLRPEKHLFVDLGLDSLDTVDLIVALQEKFDVKLRDDERVRAVRTLQDVYDYIMKVQKEMASGS